MHQTPLLKYLWKGRIVAQINLGMFILYLSRQDVREETIGRRFQLRYPLRLQGANQALRFLFMYSRRLIVRHALVSLSFVLLYLLLNRPEVIFFSRIGFVAWYPAIGLVMALLLGVSPWYALLVCLADALAGKIIYGQSAMFFSNTVGAMGMAVSYGAATYVLRGPLQIDLGLRPPPYH